MEKSTVSGNSASQFGGGLYISGTATVINSTVSGNFARRNGGGFNNTRTVTLTNSTVSGNSTAENGGGLRNRSTLNLYQTLISGNTASLQGPELYHASGIVNANRFNLFGFGGDAGVTPNFSPGPNDLIPGEALTGILDTALRNNGGPTTTHALVASSPAIEAGGTCFPTTDQRGVPRPQGADVNGDGSPDCDIGAFEVGSTPVEARPAEPNPQLRCTRSACRVRIECTLTSNSAIGCTNQVNVFVRRSAVKLGDDTAAKRPRRLRFAFGVANIPPDQTANVRLKLTKKGKKIVRTIKQKRLRGVMEIRNSAGTAVSSTPIRIRFR